MAAITHAKENIGFLDGPVPQETIRRPADMAGTSPARRDYFAFSIAILFVFSLSIIYFIISGHEELTAWMRGFIGFSLFIFGFFKVTDINGFIASFRHDDPIAKKYPDYAKLNPFLEIGIGLGLLFEFLTPLMYASAFILCLAGGLGIVKKIQAGGEITQGPLLGSRIQIPLRTASLATNALVVGMTLFSLIALI